MRGVDYLVAIYLSIIKAVLVADRKIFVKIFGSAPAAADVKLL